MPPVETNDTGQPLIHKILERLGVLDPDNDSDSIAFDAPWEGPCEPAGISRPLRPLEQTPPFTPSSQGTSYTGWNPLLGTTYSAQNTPQMNQASAEEPIIGSTFPFYPTGQATSGLMLSMPSPVLAYSALNRGNNTSLNASLADQYDSLQWPDYSLQEELYEPPGGREFPDR